jgi:glycosyltransferase involved in cell wall biosynthesis
MKYKIVTHIPFAVSKDYYLVDRLWAWELESFINASDTFKVSVIAPETSKDKIEFPYKIPKSDIEFYPLPYFESFYYTFPQFLIKLPKITYIFLKKIHKNDVMHLSGLAYPPLGMIAGLCCIIKRCKNRIAVFDADFIGDLEIFIESEKPPINRYLLILAKNIYKFIFYLHINNSSLTFVFGDKLYGRYGKNKKVIKTYASWVREKDIISHKDLKKKIQKTLRGTQIKLCFVGTLVDKKNPYYALEVVKLLKGNNIPVSLDIWGLGPLKEKLEKIIEKEDLWDEISFRGFSPYGEEFYNILRDYDAILITNLSGEQPRILFDALANGVIVIGSNIESFSSIINNGVNGFLCAKDPKSFAAVIEMLYNEVFLKKDKKFIEKIIFNGIRTVKNNTMESIYKTKMEIIKKSIKNR